MAEKEGNWFKRHKILTVIIVLVVIGAIAAASDGGSSNNNELSSGSGSGSDNSDKAYRFNDRADKQEKDVEVAVNEPATVDGVKMIITKTTKKTAIDEFEKAGSGKTYLIADVTLENVSDETKPYNVFDFRIQTQGGQVLDGAFATVEKPLNSGDLVVGGRISGQIIFEVPAEKGSQYIIWKPNAGMSDRAIVEVK